MNKKLTALVLTGIMAFSSISTTIACSVTTYADNNYGAENSLTDIFINAAGEELRNLTKDVKAKFEHGVLSLEVPKKEAPKLPEKKTIMIEG